MNAAGQRPARVRAGATAAALFAFGLLALLPWLGRPLVAREQELRVVMTARDMARGGDWVLPRYLGEQRFNKPPLLYWFVASAFKAAGTTQSPALARLPAALCGAALLPLIFLGGRYLVGRRAALIAAVVAGSSVIFLRQGRLAETDIPFALFIAAATLAMFAAIARRRRGWVAVSGLLAGAAFMIKGPAALFMPLAAAAAAAVVCPALRAGMKPARLIVWLGLCLLLAAPWYVLIMARSAAAAATDVSRELDALLRRSGHPGPFYFYLYTLPAMLLPWGLLLPFALVKAWKMARPHAGVRLLLAWFLSALLLMSLVRSKQSHYTTLLLPSSALLAGVFLDASLRAAGRYRALKAALPVAGVGLLLAAACASWLFVPKPWAYVLAIPALSGIPAMFRFRAWRRPAAAIAAIAAGTTILTWAYATGLGEWSEPARATRQAAEAVLSMRGPQAKVFLAGRRLNTMQYYADCPIQRVRSLREGLEAAADGDIILLAWDRANPVTLSPDPARPPTRVFREQGVVIELYVK